MRAIDVSWILIAISLYDLPCLAYTTKCPAVQQVALWLCDWADRPRQPAHVLLKETCQYDRTAQLPRSLLQRTRTQSHVVPNL